MQYPNSGRKTETRSWQPWYWLAHTPPDIVETLRSTSAYDMKVRKPEETFLEQQLCDGTHSTRHNASKSLSADSSRVGPEQNGNGFTMNQLPSPRASPLSCPDFRVTDFHDTENFDSVSLEYEPIPKKRHYRIIKRENKLAESRSFKAFQGNSNDNRRGESAPRFSKGIKGRSNLCGNQFLCVSPSTIMSPSIGRRGYLNDDLTPIRGYFITDGEVHCNAQLKPRVSKKKRFDSDTKSGNVSFQQFLFKLLSSDPRKCSPVPQSMSEDASDFLTPMLLHSAYSNKIPSASSQLLNILAESFALNIPDRDLINFAPNERRRRMSYTKSFVSIVAKAAGDLKWRLDPRSGPTRRVSCPAPS